MATQGMADRHPELATHDLGDQRRLVEAAADPAEERERYGHHMVRARPPGGGDGGGKAAPERDRELVLAVELEAEHEITEYALVGTHRQRRLPGRWRGPATEAGPARPGRLAPAARAAGVDMTSDQVPAPRTYASLAAAPRQRTTTDGAAGGKHDLDEGLGDDRHGVEECSSSVRRRRRYTPRREATMPTRWVARVALAMAVLSMAGVAQAQTQVAWVGAAAGRSWEYHPATQPGSTWLEGDVHDIAFSIDLPLDTDTVFCVSTFRLPHATEAVGQAWAGRFRAYTVGIDYFFPGSFGRAFFSGGAGQYTYRADSGAASKSIEASNFGWYVGVGEWFRLGRRFSLTTEVDMHRPSSADRPTLVSGLVGLSLAL
jgi:hypothetical protein